MLRKIIVSILSLCCLLAITFALLPYHTASALFHNTSFNFQAVISENKWLTFRYFIIAYAVGIMGILFYLNKHLTLDLKEPLVKSCAELSTFSNRIKNDKSTMIAMLIILIGIVLRTLYVNAPIRYDEAFTFFEFGSSPPPYAWINYSYPNNHILHSILIWCSTFIFGESLIAIRLPAFIGGILILFLSYLLLRKLNASNGSLIAALAMICFSHWLIIYTANARGYSLQISCLLWSIISLKNNQPKQTILASFLGFTLSPSYILPYSFFLGFLLAERKNITDALKNICTTVLLVVLFYLPAIGYIGLENILHNPNIEKYGETNRFWSILMNVKQVFQSVFTFDKKGYLSISCAVLLLTLGFMQQYSRKVIAISLTILITVMIILNKSIPSRAFLFLIPALVIIGFSNLKKLDLKTGAITGLVIFGAWILFKKNWFDYERPLMELPQLTRKITTEYPDQPIVSKIPLDYPIRYYLNNNLNLWNVKNENGFIVIICPYYQQSIEQTFPTVVRDYNYEPVANKNGFKVYRCHPKTTSTSTP